MIEIGTATDYLDLLGRLDTFLTSKGSAFGLTYQGTGNGLLTAYAGGASSIAEAFTITATDATHFSVVGSTSGSLGTATVGTTFTHAKLTFLISAGGTAFIAGDVFTLSTAPPWTRKLGPTAASVTQWRVNVLNTVGGTNGQPVTMARVEMMTTAGGADQVTGGTASASSTSGSNVAGNAANTNDADFWQGTGPNGWWQYTFGGNKTIVEFAIRFPTGSTAVNAPKDLNLEYWNGTTWVAAASFRNETGWSLGERRVFSVKPYIWQAPGNDGAAQILVGVHPFSNAGAGWYDWRLNGFTAYDASADWFSQPGAVGASSPFGPVLPLSNSSIGYWFVANGRRVAVVTKCGSVYGAAYLGLIQPYASPGQWPYPLFVGGALWFDVEPTSTSNLWLVGTAHSKHTCFPLPFIPLVSGTPTNICSSARLRKPDGSWLALSARSDFYDPTKDSSNNGLQGSIWPWAYGCTNQKPDLDGAYSIFPAVLLERTPDNVYGQLDGVHYVSGSGLSAEASISVPRAAPANGNDSYVAFPDTTRSTAADFFALRLD